MALFLSGLVVLGQLQNPQGTTPQDDPARLSPTGQLRVPNRAARPLFQGDQGKQKTEIHFNPATGIVTIKLLVQDPNGYFIPNIRRDNFVVYENGVRQNNATVEIEHASVSLGLLIEYGGRYQALNRDMSGEVSRASRQLLSELGRDDKLAIWTYGDTVNQLTDFSQVSEGLDRLLDSLQPPAVSETNFYDAVVVALDRMRPVVGRKAMILISSGVDTFSKAKYEDVLTAVRNNDTPVYVINLGPTMRQTAEIRGLTKLLKVDWKGVENNLLEIAKASGGRLYSPENLIDLSATYDDIMENLRVRYVITYKSSNGSAGGGPRTVRVELVNPKTGQPLQIVDRNGKVIRPSVVVQESYTPSGGR
jgi:VWFA-related protein